MRRVGLDILVYFKRSRSICLMCCMLVLVSKGRNNLYNVMINMPETIARDICIKIETANSKSQGVVLKKKQKPT